MYKHAHKICCFIMAINHIARKCTVIYFNLYHISVHVLEVVERIKKLKPTEIILIVHESVRGQVILSGDLHT